MYSRGGGLKTQRADHRLRAVFSGRVGPPLVPMKGPRRECVSAVLSLEAGSSRWDCKNDSGDESTVKINRWGMVKWFAQFEEEEFF